LKPVIAITAGDPCGIGPEVAVKAFKDVRIRKICTPVLIGEKRSLVRAGWSSYLSSVIGLDEPELNLNKHKPDKLSGFISYKCANLALKLALKKKIDAIVTGPVSKEAWNLAGIKYSGHTQLFAEKTGKKILMAFVSRNLRVALATEHVAIEKLPRSLKKKDIVIKLSLFYQALKSMGLVRPRIFVCALNPHAGDGGILGKEEQTIIGPAITQAKHKGIKTDGPFPGDKAWIDHVSGKCNGLFCMYHDQAIAGLKLISKHPVVHWTYGLPFARTSPAHGTAFDIAGKNIADPQSMIEAIIFAVRLLCRDSGRP
jgi:4-hydroxythreonine-4-phosphate dehydrogenase